jgi:hypothetical protein
MNLRVYITFCTNSLVESPLHCVYPSCSFILLSSCILSIVTSCLLNFSSSKLIQHQHFTLQTLFCICDSGVLSSILEILVITPFTELGNWLYYTQMNFISW